jgi:hypothetical protein
MIMAVITAVERPVCLVVDPALVGILTMFSVPGRIAIVLGVDRILDMSRDGERLGRPYGDRLCGEVGRGLGRLDGAVAGGESRRVGTRAVFSVARDHHDDALTVVDSPAHYGRL